MNDRNETEDEGSKHEDDNRSSQLMTGECGLRQESAAAAFASLLRAVDSKGVVVVFTSLPASCFEEITSMISSVYFLLSC